MAKHYIKYINFLLVSILIVSQSCKKDAEDAVLSPQELIIGEWAIEYLDPDITINGINLTNIPPELLGLSEVENQILTLLLSPNSSSLFEEVIISFASDATLNIASEGISETEINYELTNENLLVLSWDNEEEVSIEITELTAHNMDMRTTQQFLMDLTENGRDEVVDVILNIRLVKNNK